MKTKTLFLLLALVAAMGAQASTGGFDAAASGNTFGLELYQALRAEGQNLFFSPASVAYALSMTSTGAAGKTAAEMEQVLRLPADKDLVASGFGELMKGLTGRDHVTLHLANRLYGEKSYAFHRAFLDRLARDYGAGFEAVDFIHAYEAARLNINGWVADQTADKIPELLEPGILDELTTLVLVNAIYFLGTWVTEFPSDATADGVFHTEGGAEASVPFMHVTEDFPYAEVDGLQILALPYHGGELEFVIALPAAGQALADIEADLDAATLARWLAAPAVQRVKVGLPRLHLETEFELNRVLAAMGMPTAFTRAADFSGMSPQGGGLFISNVVHKAYLDVDEKGTEAAAATAVVMKRTSAAPPVEAKVFRADRPFVFAIRDRTSGAVLFMGRVADPS